MLVPHASDPPAEVPTLRIPESALRLVVPPPPDVPVSEELPLMFEKRISLLDSSELDEVRELESIPPEAIALDESGIEVIVLSEDLTPTEAPTPPEAPTRPPVCEHAPSHVDSFVPAPRHVDRSGWSLTVILCFLTTCFVVLLALAAKSSTSSGHSGMHARKHPVGALR